MSGGIGDIGAASMVIDAGNQHDFLARAEALGLRVYGLEGGITLEEIRLGVLGGEIVLHLGESYAFLAVLRLVERDAAGGLAAVLESLGGGDALVAIRRLREQLEIDSGADAAFRKNYIDGRDLGYPGSEMQDTSFFSPIDEQPRPIATPGCSYSENQERGKELTAPIALDTIMT